MFLILYIFPYVTSWMKISLDLEVVDNWPIMKMSTELCQRFFIFFTYSRDYSVLD